MLNSLKEFADKFVAEDAATLIASQQQLILSTQQESKSSTVPAIVASSPYFAKTSTASATVFSSPEVFCISEDQDNSALSENDNSTVANSPIKIDARSREMNVTPVKAFSKISPVAVHSHEIKTTPIRRMLPGKKPFATLLGNSNKLSQSQRKLAAENGSHYFQLRK